VNTQGQFNFETSAHSGYAQWITSRQLAVKDLARRVQLPINRRVEVWLQGGVRLRGKLKLKEEWLFFSEENLRHLEMTIEGVPFTYREMESCVTLD
jgi:hypothetical protein